MINSEGEYVINVRSLVEEYLDEHPPERLDPSSRPDPAQRLDPRVRFSTAYEAKTQLGLNLWTDLNRAVHRGDPAAIAFRNAVSHFTSTVNEVMHERYGTSLAPTVEEPAEPPTDTQPAFGKSVLAVILSGSTWDQTVGDLEEGSQDRLGPVGRRVAVVWYWFRIACEVFDAIPRRLGGLLKVIGIVEAIHRGVEWFLRLFR